MARIGLLTTSFPRHEGDISGHFVAGFARALVARGHEVEVLSPAHPDIPAVRKNGTPPQTETIQKAYDPRPATGYHRLRTAPAAGSPSLHVVPVRYAIRPSHQQLFYGAGVPDNLRARPYLAPQLATFSAMMWRAAKARAPGWDAVVSHWALPCGLIAGEFHPHLPHLAVCHSADIHALTQRWPLLQRLRQRVVDRARALWFVSQQAAERFTSQLFLGSTGLHIQPMGHEPQPPMSVLEAKQKSAIHAERFTALILGRLVPIKRVDLAIEATLRTPNIDLIIAGDGPERAQLQAMATRYGRRVRFTGTVHGDMKRALLHGADALLLTSQSLPNGRTEGMPTVILEALQARLPVISTRAGGIPEWLTHERDALLLDDPTPDLLSAAMLRLAQDQALRKRLQHQGLRLAQRQCWSQVAPHIEHLLWDGRFAPAPRTSLTSKPSH